MEMKICPSVLAGDFLHLEDSIKKAEAAGSDILHLDVMDGVYVPNMSFGFDIIKKIGTVTTLPMDVHMMTVCPGKYIDNLADCGAWSVTIHLGLYSEEETKEILRHIRSRGMKAALSLKPGEAAEMLMPYIGEIDMALIMSVEPGFGGQKFMTDVLPKIEVIRNTFGRDFPVQIDGGISASTVEAAAAAGASLFVVGTASFGAPDMGEAVREIRDLAEKAFK